MPELSDGLEIFFTRRRISSTVRRLAGQISRDYRGANPLLLGIMKGSFVFLSDLIRKIEEPLEIDFICLSSYFNGTTSSGKITLHLEPRISVSNRHVILVEDIVDTGLTTSYALDYLKTAGAASSKLCCLIDKPSRRVVPVHIDYPGFTAPDRFMVGYGLDFNEKYRRLPDICVLGGTSCQ